MADSFTDNCGLVLQLTGSNVGTWGSEQSTLDFTPIDSVLGKTLAVSLASSTVNLSQSQRQNLAYALSGTLSANIIITFPLGFNSATVACGGTFVFDNQTTGAFTVTVKTVASGSTGVVVPQGLRSTLYSNGTNVYYASDGDYAKFNSYAGNPNGNVTGYPASATRPADSIWDRTNFTLYISYGNGAGAAGTVWKQSVPTPATASSIAQGYLTLSSSTTNPILQTDSVAATSVYFTPFIGNLISIPDGSTFTTYTFTQLTLGVQALQAGGLFDVFGFLYLGNPFIGVGPVWNTNSAGVCSRGTGAATTELTRLNGVLVNANNLTGLIINGGSLYDCATRCGVYLGTIYIDPLNAGHVTCHRSWGQLRRWGVWNYYNRQPVYLKCGDSTTPTWTYGTATFRPSNGDVNNSLTLLTGFSEDPVSINFLQRTATTADATSFGEIAIGFNSTSSVVGNTNPTGKVSNGTSQFVFNNIARFEGLPATVATSGIGIQTVSCLEAGDGSSLVTYYGSAEVYMCLDAVWRA